MPSDHGGEVAGQPPARPAAILADRLAAALVHHEPGWRLPRRTALARRYNTSLSELDEAIAVLIRRSLVRPHPDGQLYRSSPADYLIPVEGVAGLGARVDPMGSPVRCHSRNVSSRSAPADIAWAVGVPEGGSARMVRSVWTVAGEPAAIATTYLPDVPPGAAGAAGTAGAQRGHAPANGGTGAEEDPVVPGQARAEEDFGRLLSRLPGQPARPMAASMEMGPPQPAAARSLRLAPGRPVITVTIRFEAGAGTPAGLTVVLLRPELFRVAIEAAGGGHPGPGGLACPEPSRPGPGLTGPDLGPDLAGPRGAPADPDSVIA